MRFEEEGSQIRIVQPGPERVRERGSYFLACVLSGAPATASLYYAWFASPGSDAAWATGVVFSLISAGLFWKSEELRDEAWAVELDQEARVLKVRGEVVARFDEVRVVRSTSIEHTQHVLTLIVQRGRGFREILLCSMAGRAEDEDVFKAASVAIARGVGARPESRSHASPRARIGAQRT